MWPFTWTYFPDRPTREHMSALCSMGQHEALGKHSRLRHLRSFHGWLILALYKNHHIVPWWPWDHYFGGECQGRRYWKKVILDFGCVSMGLRILDVTMFVVKTCLAYFLREELNSISPAKPLRKVLTVVSKLLLSILLGKVENNNDDQWWMWPRLVLSGSHSGRQCTW